MTRVGWATLLAVAIPIAVLFGPVLTSDRSLAMRDAAHFYHPLFAWCCREWAAGRVPLWNPHENCGLPVLADASSSVFYPGKLLFLLPVDFAVRYNLYLIAHVVLAAAGSYWLARAWRASPPAAALAAIAYSCGGNVVFQYCNAVFLVGAAWLPLAALAADRMLRGRSWRAALAFGLVLALMILGGDPQAAYHGLMIAGLYALVLAFSKDTETPRPLTARGRGLAMNIGLIGLAAVSGFALAAVQILPSSEATQFSERAAYDRPRNIYEAAALLRRPESELPEGQTRGQPIAGGLFGKIPAGSHQALAYDFSVGPWRLTEYFWPNVGGRMLPTNRRWFSLLPVEGRIWTPTLYMGLLPVLLGLAGFRLWRGEPRERWLSWLVLIFTLASFGMYGLGWLYIESCQLLRHAKLLTGDATKIDLAPGFGGLYWLFVTLLPTYIYFRYPAKLLPLVSLGLSQLAAGGWDRTFAQPRPWLRHVMLGLGAVSAIAAFIVWSIPTENFVAAMRNRGDTSLGPMNAPGMHRDILFAFLQTALVAFAAVWLLKRAWNEPAKSGNWQIGLLGLTAVEVAFANGWLVLTAPADIWRKESPMAAAMHTAGEDALPPRVYRASFESWRPPSFKKQWSNDRPAELARWERDTFFPKYHLQSNVSLVQSYGSIKLLDYDSLFIVAQGSGPEQPDKSRLPHGAMLRMLGTEYQVLPEKGEPKLAERVSPAADWPESASLWRTNRPLPRAWVVHTVDTFPPLPRQLQIAAVDRRSAEVLFPDHKARDFRRTAVVETDQPLAEWKNGPAAAPPAESEPCRITHYDPQHVVIVAELTRPGLLVLSDAFFPGWNATVTTGGRSQPAAIYRTNRVLRGVWLPAGQHTVEYRFQPSSFYRGSLVSALAWSALAIVGLAIALRRRGTHSRANK